MTHGHIRLASNKTWAKSLVGWPLTTLTHAWLSAAATGWYLQTSTSLQPPTPDLSILKQRRSPAAFAIYRPFARQARQSIRRAPMISRRQSESWERELPLR